MQRHTDASLVHFQAELPDFELLDFRKRAILSGLSKAFSPDALIKHIDYIYFIHYFHILLCLYYFCSWSICQKKIC